MRAAVAKSRSTVGRGSTVAERAEHSESARCTKVRAGSTSGGSSSLCSATLMNEVTNLFLPNARRAGSYDGRQVYMNVCEGTSTVDRQTREKIDLQEVVEGGPNACSRGLSSWRVVQASVVSVGMKCNLRLVHRSKHRPATLLDGATLINEWRKKVSPKCSVTVSHARGLLYKHTRKETTAVHKRNGEEIEFEKVVEWG